MAELKHKRQHKKHNGYDFYMDVDVPPYVNKEFLKLRDHWYRKAKKSGFRDIEDIKLGVYNFDPPLIKNWYIDLITIRQGLLQKKDEYFRLLGKYVNSNVKFKTKKHRDIMERVANGETYASIGKSYNCTRAAIYEILFRLRKEMIKTIDDWLYDDDEDNENGQKNNDESV